MCDDLSKKIGGKVYYSDHPNKSKNLKEWTEGAMFGTGALGAGLDVEGILDVFHIGVPYGMIPYIQESGRAGRNQEIVRSMILMADWDYERLENENPDELTDDQKVMREFILSSDCRRKEMGIYLNGIGLTCSELGGKLCDNCLSKEGNELHREKRRRQEETEMNVMQKARKLEKRGELVKTRGRGEADLENMIEEHLNMLRGGCGACWMENEWEVGGHSVDECEYLESLLGEKYGIWKGKHMRYFMKTMLN